jgi:hypothetical protein
MLPAARTAAAIAAATVIVGCGSSSSGASGPGERTTPHQAEAHLLSANTSPSTTQTGAGLLRLSICLRRHSYPSIPDPRPDPPPSHSSKYDTLYGAGNYWIGVPKSINAHGAAFVQTARACHATGVG